MDMNLRMQELIKANPFISKTDIVYTIILEEILQGKMRGGQRINQEELSARLGISRSPVREALNRLSAEGYLIKEGASGYHIYTLRMEDYITINDFRAMLEIYSIELAVRNITSKHLQQLKQNIVSTKTAVSNGDVRAFAQLDSEFHRLLVAASNNPHIMQTYENYEEKFYLFCILTLNRETLPDAYRWHKMIYEAIVSGDVEGAVKSAKVHRDNTVHGALMTCKNIARDA